MIENGLSIDVDDFVSAFSDSYNISGNMPQTHISEDVERVLQLLKRKNIRATFFVNGKSIAHSPTIINKIHDLGHEIGCHGYSHKYIWQYKTQQEFEEDLEKCLELIYRQTGVKPSGYRSPGCTLTFNRHMVLNALEKFGFSYDSSLTTFGFSKQHKHTTGPAHPFKWENDIVEFPLSSTPFGPVRIPAFGSYFLRIFPAFLTHLAISKLNHHQHHAFLYFHGFELFRRKYPKDIMNIHFPFVRVYNLRSGARFEAKLACILQKHAFVPYGELLPRFSQLPPEETLDSL